METRENSLKKVGRPPKRPEDRSAPISITLYAHQLAYLDAQDKPRSWAVRDLIDREIEGSEKYKADGILSDSTRRKLMKCRAISKQAD